MLLMSFFIPLIFISIIVIILALRYVYTSASMNIAVGNFFLNHFMICRQEKDLIEAAPVKFLVIWILSSLKLEVNNKSQKTGKRPQ